LLAAEGEADVVAVAGHFRLAGVDANELPALLFGKMADGWDIGAGADFDADEAVDRSQLAVAGMPSRTLLQRFASGNCA
jgi:hypothetical protein